MSNENDGVGRSATQQRLQLPPRERGAVPPQDHYEATDVYKNLVEWYHDRPKTHAGALVGIALLNLALLLWVLLNPMGPGKQLYSKMAIWYKVPLEPNPTLIEGYKHYTPVYWVVALALGLISLFVVRYSHPGDAEGKSERFGNRIREVMLTPATQNVIIVLSVGLLIVEFIGIITKTFTISAFVRGWAIAFPWLYWVGGGLTACLCGLVIDLQRIPRLIRFMLIIWVVVLSHIFWWITPK